MNNQLDNFSNSKLGVFSTVFNLMLFKLYIYFYQQIKLLILFVQINQSLTKPNYKILSIIRYSKMGPRTNAGFPNVGVDT